MKVVAMAGGLGSQMFKYAFYLNIKNKRLYRKKLLYNR